MNAAPHDDDTAEGSVVRAFRPSLLLNLGHSHELLGDNAQAHHYYDHALAAVHDLQMGAYREMIEHSLNEKVQRFALPQAHHA